MYVHPDDAMLNIYTDTVFVAVVIDAVLLCLLSIRILLLQPFWLFQPLFWDTPLLDGLVLLLGFPLLFLRRSLAAMELEPELHQ